MQFGLSRPPPGDWLALYARRTGCQPVVTHAPSPAGSGRRVLAARTINRYYAPRYRYWPLVRLGNPAAGRVVARWLARGITPGVVLPPLVGRLSPRERQRAKRLADSGALFVLETRRGHTRFNGPASAYAAIGVVVSAVFIDRGYAPDLDVLPGGTYLVARHWKGRPDLPIPRRAIRDDSHTFIPISARRIRPRDADQPAAPRPRGTPYTPAPAASWQFAGVDFHVDGDGEHTSLTGWVLQSLLSLVATVSVQFERPVRGITGLVLAGLAWVAIAIGLLSILVLVIGVLRGVWSSAST